MNFSRLLQTYLWIFFCAIGVSHSDAQGFFQTYLADSAFCHAVVQHTGGGFYMAGKFQSGNIQKTDSNGVIQWDYPGLFPGGRGTALCLAPNGDAIALGEYLSTNGELKNRLVRISAAGVLQWQTDVPKQWIPDALVSIATVSTGGYLASGNTRSENNQIWLVRFDESGQMLWQKNVGDPTKAENVTQMIGLSDGNFAIGGVRNNGSIQADGFLAKIDENGNLLWEKGLKIGNFLACKDLVEQINGNIVMLADNLGSANNAIALLAWQPNGNVAWARTLDLASLYNNSGILLPIITSIGRDADDNLYFPLYAGLDGINPATLYWIKTNPFGQFLDAFLLNSADFIRDVILVDDNNFVMAGAWNDQAFLLKTDLTGHIYTHRLLGMVYDDQNGDCLKTGTDAATPGLLIEARDAGNQAFFTKSGSQGQFALSVPAGNYQIFVHPKADVPGLYIPCDTPSVQIGQNGQQISLAPIGVSAATKCPFMELNISPGLMRRCTTNTVQIGYCNLGTLPTQDVAISLVLDPKLNFQGASIPLYAFSNDTLWFHPTNDCSQFTVHTFLACDAPIGDNICLEGHISPDTLCFAPNPFWDGSNLEVKASCNGTPKFTVRNTGHGDMSNNADYVIIEDQIMVAHELRLKAGKDTLITPNNILANAYYLRVKQSPGHPGNSYAADALYHCNGAGGSNLPIQLPLQSDNPFTQKTCREIVGSFDPNDKQGFPLGWKDAHLIEGDQTIDYTIRFQNTGNDTAFTVKILDEYSPYLNPASFRAGPSSHPFTWEISETQQLVFYFPNIQLPDSNVNELASHGFIQFQIKPYPNLPVGTLLENKAEIYFDLNPAVVTNITQHQIGQSLFTLIKNPHPESLSFSVFPNPAQESALFQLNAETGGINRLEVYNLWGKMVSQQQFTGRNCLFHRNTLPDGVYFFQLKTPNGAVGTGKILFSPN